MSDRIIRPLAPSDISEWYDLRTEALRTYPRSFGASLEDHLGRSHDECLHFIVDQPQGSFVIGGFVEDHLVATAGILRGRRKSAHRSELWGVFASDSVRGQGWGRLVIEAALDRLRKYGDVDFVSLAVATDGHFAVNLYQSLGFRSYGIEEDAMRVDGQVVDFAHMTLALR